MSPRASRFEALHLIGIVLITIAFLIATLPVPAHAQRADVCGLILIPPKTDNPLPPNRENGIAKGPGRHIA